MRRLPQTADEYQRLIVQVAQEEGFEVVTKDGVAYLRVTFIDEYGAESMSEVNITRFAEAMERKLS